MNSNDLNRKEVYNDEGSFIHIFFKNKKIQIRNDFFQIFKRFTNFSKNTSIIDIGTTPSLADDQNIFLSNLTENKNITCLSNQDCSILKKKIY